MGRLLIARMSGLVIVLFSSYPTAFAASDVRTQLSNAPDWDFASNGPVCGVYAACNALRIVGIAAKPEEFVATRYIGVCGGSSAAELSRLVEDAGGRATVLTRLSRFDFRFLNCPIVANVRANPFETTYNHWVTVLAEGDEVIVLDGPDKQFRLPTAEFLGLWSGLGILVSSKEDNPVQSVFLGRVLLVQLGLLGGVVIGGRGLKTIRRCLSSHRSQIFGICAAVILLTVIGNGLFGDLPHHSSGVAAATAMTQRQAKRGSLSDVAEASSDISMLLVDARLPTDFSKRTVNRAINIPITASPWTIREYLSKLDRETPIVVFCHTARCNFDDRVAQSLIYAGFQNVIVSDAGYVEYVARSHSGHK